MGKRIGMVVFGVALMAAPITAFAASEWASEATWGAQATGKLKYGLTNTLLGWTSIVREPVQASQAGENVVVGIGRGLWNAVGQTLGGAVDTVTFFVPQIDVPLPKGGTDILKK